LTTSELITVLRTALLLHVTKSLLTQHPWYTIIYCLAKNQSLKYTCHS